MRKKWTRPELPFSVAPIMNWSPLPSFTWLWCSVVSAAGLESTAGRPGATRPGMGTTAALCVMRWKGTCCLPQGLPKGTSRAGDKPIHQFSSGTPAKRERNSTMIIFCIAVKVTGCWQLTVTARDPFVLRKTVLSTLKPKGTFKGEHNKWEKRIGTRWLFRIEFRTLNKFFLTYIIWTI